MEKLPPIPIPAMNLWRELRQRFIPPLAFLLAVAFVTWLWREQSNHGAFVGSAEARRAVVSSTFPGTIRLLAAAPYQVVHEGDPIAVIEPIDPRSQLDLLRSRLQVAMSRMEPTVAQRNALDYERQRAEVLRLKVELAKDKVNLEHAERELKRNEGLLRDKLVAQDVYDLALRNRDMQQVDVSLKGKMIEELEAGLIRLRSIGDPNLAVTNTTLLRQIEALETQLTVTTNSWGPVTLSAPISGIVSVVHRGTGEQVMDGDPLVTIQSPQAERIVGYLRQPFPFEPAPGMRVEVKTRARKPRVVLGEIQQVGAQLEPITNALAMMRPGMIVDIGLPVVVNLPDGLVLRPGELVDLLVREGPSISATAMNP